MSYQFNSNGVIKVRRSEGLPGKSYGPFALLIKSQNGGGKSEEELEEERLYIQAIMNIR